MKLIEVRGYVGLHGKRIKEKGDPQKDRLCGRTRCFSDGGREFPTSFC
jgi:hypothetical protein